jgi:Ca-activated chloride channel family protein
MSLPTSFLAPGRLWLLLLVAALAAVYVLVQRQRAEYVVRFTELSLLASVAPKVPAWRRHVPAALLLLALTVLTVAVARPQGEVQVPRETATVVLAIDVSLSMQAVDVEPDRFQAAQASAVEFVEELPEGFDVGLVAFSGSASVVVPPTRDHAAVSDAVRSLQLGPSTAIGEAVFASLDALRSVPRQEGEEPSPARVVLLTDGTNTVGRGLSEAAQAAREQGVPVSTISFGTPDGVVQVEGQLVPVPVDVASMETLALDTGGAAFTAESGEELDAVYQDIGEQVGTTTEEREVTDLVAGLALLLAVLAGAASLAWGARLP